MPRENGKRKKHSANGKDKRERARARAREKEKHEVQNRCDFIVPKNNNESRIYCINETCLEIDVKSSENEFSKVTKVAAMTVAQWHSDG